MISSAVAIPDEPQPQAESPEQTTSRKRRQSSVSSESSKRPRLDAPTSNGAANSPSSASRTHSPPTTRNGAEAMSPPSQPDTGRRKSSLNVEQDKSRNRRLFGALLGTLSQPSRPSKSAAGSDAASVRNSRREEIENRQRERLKREHEELADNARRKKEELDRVRQGEQQRWEEEGMKIRHRNLRATARFLKTKAEPPLYYKPWEVREQEEEAIKRQIDEVEETIRREVAESEVKRRPAPKSPESRQDRDPDVENDQTRQTDYANGTSNEEKLPTSSGNEPKPSEGDDESKTVQTGVSSDAETVPEQKAKDETQRPVSKDDDHGGEELELGQEDDVIY